MQNRSFFLMMALAISVGLVMTTSGCRKKEVPPPPKPPSPPADTSAAPAPQGSEEPAKPAEIAPPVATPPPAEPPVAPAKVAPAASTRPLESIEQELLEKWDGIQSFTAKVTTKADRQGPEAADHLTGQGFYECMKKDGKLLARFEVVNRIVRKDEVAELMRDERKVVTVLDGESLYVYTEGGGMPTAHRYPAKSDQIIQLGGRHLFNQLHQLNELEVLPDETIDGRAVYVIGGIPKDTGGRATYYFDQQTGIMVKLFMEHQPTNSSRSIAIGEVKIDPELDDERFTFTVPEGVPLIEPAPGGAPLRRRTSKAIQPD